MKLLIVDDNAATRSLIREFIAPIATEITECADGADGVEAYLRLRPDFVVMDFMMPGLDGIAATERLLAHDPHAAVVMVSQFDSREARLRSQRAGARQFFTKDNLSALRRFLTAARDADRA
jgi:CheY-like chemotaxis protein